MSIKEVAAFFGRHEDTIRNWMDEARAGKINFPLPINPPGKKNLWRRSDIEGWDASKQERPETPVERAVRESIIKNRLARHGLYIS